jgi:hypothetical protein
MNSYWSGVTGQLIRFINFQPIQRRRAHSAALRGASRGAASAEVNSKAGRAPTPDLKSFFLNQQTGLPRPI